MLALALLASTFASAEQATRFSGGGGLSVDTVQLSADQRFSLNAALQAAPAPEKASTDGRFALNAALAANKARANVGSGYSPRNPRPDSLGLRPRLG